MNNSSPVAKTVAGFEVLTRQPVQSNTQVSDNSLLDRLYKARGVSSTHQLDSALTGLLPFESLKDIESAVHLLSVALENSWRVLIVGDYDADGATSTALAMLGLTQFGLDVHYLLPNRFEFGYGLSVGIVELALQQQPDLIITVDNGIASIEGVALAKTAGVKVLITDHHLAGSSLPNADAIVNPNQPECGFQSKAACGCTVLFYVLIAFRASLRDKGVSSLPNLGQWLDLVALATVADVVPLDENNRRLVQQGLNRIRSGQCRAGIKALYEVAGREWQQAQSSDFGFIIGPRLNAAGRLDDMTLGVQLLLCDSEHEARPLAAELHALNVERRQIEASMVNEVQAVIPKITDEIGQFGLVVYGEDWHEGVIGILASRVKDKCHKPVFALSDSKNDVLKGSGRSVQGVHLKDCLDWIAIKEPKLLLKYGGHAMAAGLSIRKESLNQFQKLFNDAVKSLADPELLQPHLWTDGELGPLDLTLENALLIERAGPWGQAFPEPSFYGEWKVVSSRVLSGKHLKLVVCKGSLEVDGIAFNVDENLLQGVVERVRGIYQLGCNRFRGNTTLQLVFSKIERFL